MTNQLFPSGFAQDESTRRHTAGFVDEAAELAWLACTLHSNKPYHSRVHAQIDWKATVLAVRHGTVGEYG